MLQEMQIGRGRAEALRSLGDRTNLPDLRSFVSAMVQADAFGIPVGQVLRVQSSEIRVKRRQWAEEAAQKVPVKILVPLIFCILPCLFIAVLGPAGISDHGQLLGQTLSVTDVGRVALAARVFTVAALTSLAAVAGQRYLDGALFVVLTAAVAQAVAMTDGSPRPRWPSPRVASIAAARGPRPPRPGHRDAVPRDPGAHRRRRPWPCRHAARDRHRVRGARGGLGPRDPGLGPPVRRQWLHLAGHRPSGSA